MNDDEQIEELFVLGNKAVIYYGELIMKRDAEFQVGDWSFPTVTAACLYIRTGDLSCGWPTI